MRFFKSRLIILLGALFLSIASIQSAWSAPKAEVFGQLVAGFDAAISPDGTRVAVIRAVDGNYVVQIVALDKEPNDGNDALALGPGAKPKWIKWANNDRVFVALWGSFEYGEARQTTGSRLKDSAYNSASSTAAITVSSIYSIDSDTLEGRILVRPQGFRQYNDVVLDWLEDDPDYVLMEYAGDGSDQIYPDVRKVHVVSGRDSVVHRKSFGIADWITTTDGQVIAGSGFTGSSGLNVKVIVRDPQSEKFVNISDFAGLSVDDNIVSGFPDMERVVIRAFRDQDTRGLHIYDLRKQAFTETIFQNETFDAGAPIFSSDGTKIVGASYTANVPVRQLLPEYGQRLIEVENMLEGYTVQLIDQSADGETLLIRVSNPYDPGGLYVYRSGQPLSLLTANYPGLEPQSLGNVVAVRYTSRDGTKIPAYVSLPTKVRDAPQIKDLPFIVLPHGGPYARDYKTFDWMAQLFAAHGYGVLQMNFRGSTGYGGVFEQAGREDWTLIQDDVEDGTRYLIEKGYADPDRICIAGWSFGGYAALMGAANDPDLYQCTLAIAALTDVKGFYQDRQQFAFGKGGAKRFLGNLLDDDDIRRANTPVDRANDITVPVLLAHGTLDSVVDFDQYVSMDRALDGGRGHVRLRFEDDDHYISVQENRQDLAKNMIDFVEDHLGKSKLGAD
jgi:dipeptidyl aminopeptidase/acylaminoacyl peptidase